MAQMMGILFVGLSFGGAVYSMKVFFGGDFVGGGIAGLLCVLWGSFGVQLMATLIEKRQGNVEP